MLGLILVALRLALGLVGAPLVAWHLSRALGTRVEIGDLGVQPLDAIVTLRDVTVHAPQQAGGSARLEPPIVAERARVDVQWLPLFHQTLRVREVVLESARVDLDRFPDGGFGLANLERADPASELPAGWSFALDRIALRDSRLRVRDLAAGDASVVEAAIHYAEVSGLQRRASAFGKATNLRVDALVAGGQLRVRGHYELGEDGIVLDAQLRVKNVPLAHVKSYVADLGWTDLSGQVSGRMQWQRRPDRRDLLSGRIVLRHGSVQVAGLTEPALAVRRGVADGASIDLLRRRIAIGSLTLHGATLAVRPDIALPVPLIATIMSRPAPRAGRPGRAARARAEPPLSWSWIIEHVATADARVRVDTPDGAFNLRTRVAGENLGPGAYWSPLRIEVARGDVVVTVDGNMRVAHGLTIEGRMITSGIDVPRLARAAHLPWAELVQSGRAAVDLTVGFDSAPEDADASPLYARGNIGVTDLWIAGQDPGALTFSAGHVDLYLDGFALGEPAGVSSGGGPMRIRFSDAYVEAPSALLLRMTDGQILLPLTQEGSSPGDETVQIVFDKLRSSDGSVTVVDLVPTPPATWALTRLDGTAHAVALPAFTFDSLQVRGVDRRFGDLQLGASRRGATTFDVTATRVPLASTTPYLSLANLPYRFASGQGSFIAHGSLEPAGWRADAALTLQAPDLIDPEATLQAAIGMPVPDAIALLQDQNGDVALQLALAPPRVEAGDSYANQVAAGVREAISRARDAAQPLPPVTVLFPPGRSELTMSAMKDLAPLARLLGSRPTLVVELTAGTSHADRRWLTEQGLRGELEDTGGFMGVLRALGMRQDRERIQTALAARARGEPGLLDPSDEALLARLVAQAPAVDDSTLAALREARLTQVVNHLADTYSVAGHRVIVHAAAPTGGAPLAAVRAQVVPAPAPTIDPRSAPPPAAAALTESPLPPP